MFKKKMKMKEQISKLYLDISKDVEIALKTCMNERKFRTKREYVERLILDDFNRLNEQSLRPEYQPQTIKLDQIFNLLKPILEQAYLARGLAAHNAIILLSKSEENQKTSQENARDLVKKGVVSMLENLKKEVNF